MSGWRTELAAGLVVTYLSFGKSCTPEGERSLTHIVGSDLPTSKRNDIAAAADAGLAGGHKPVLLRPSPHFRMKVDNAADELSKAGMEFGYAASPAEIGDEANRQIVDPPGQPVDTFSVVVMGRLVPSPNGRRRNLPLNLP